MGWTGMYHAEWKNGKIDRKATLDNVITGTSGARRIVKSQMVGTTYYAAVETLKKYVKAEDGTGDEYGYKYIDVPENEREIWGLVCLTSVQGNEFRYKDISEDAGPCESDCPVSIIKLLSPTTRQWANEWRSRCIENAEKKKAAKKNPTSLKNLPVGASIQFKAPFTTTACYEGEIVTLTKRVRHGYRRDTYFWSGYGYRWPDKMIPDNYTVLSMESAA